MYERNVCCYYISSRIMKNKYCHYIRKLDIVIIHRLI